MISSGASFERLRWDQRFAAILPTDGGRRYPPHEGTRRTREEGTRATLMTASTSARATAAAAAAPPALSSREHYPHLGGNPSQIFSEGSPDIERTRAVEERQRGVWGAPDSSMRIMQDCLYRTEASRIRLNEAGQTLRQAARAVTAAERLAVSTAEQLEQAKRQCVEATPVEVARLRRRAEEAVRQAETWKRRAEDAERQAKAFARRAEAAERELDRRRPGELGPGASASDEGWSTTAGGRSSARRGTSSGGEEGGGVPTDNGFAALDSAADADVEDEAEDTRGGCSSEGSTSRSSTSGSAPSSSSGRRGRARGTSQSPRASFDPRVVAQVVAAAVVTALTPRSARSKRALSLEQRGDRDSEEGTGLENVGAEGPVDERSRGQEGRTRASVERRAAELSSQRSEHVTTAPLAGRYSRPIRGTRRIVEAPVPRAAGARRPGAGTRG